MFYNKYIVIRNLATLFIVCNMLYWFFPFPPFVWRIGLVLLSIFAAIFNTQKTVAEKYILIFATLNLLHFFISYLWIFPSISLIGNVLCALIPFSLFVYLSKNGAMTDSYFSIVCLCLIVASILGYYHLRVIMIEKLLLDSDSDVTNNATVCFLFLIPMLFFVRRKPLKWALLVVCLFFLLAGAKRGNIVAAIIPTSLFIWCELKDNKSSTAKPILVIIATIGLCYILYRWFIANDYLMHRLESTIEGNSSGRDVIYANAIHTWFDSNNILNYILGYGFDGTIHSILIAEYAHNDWLEILVDYGLLGVTLYFLVFISLLKQYQRTIDEKMRMVILSVLFIWGFKSLYSMGFTSDSMYLLMMSLGTVVGRNEIEGKVEEIRG